MGIPITPELYVQQNLTLLLQTFWQELKNLTSYVAKHSICKLCIQETLY
jgi:hypothetical protein